MGKLIKNHWARLIVLTAATYQLAAGLEGIFWPKIFWDFLTKNLDGAVKPAPVLQILNILFALFFLAWEWPLRFIANSAMHRSIEARLVALPLTALAALLLYQGTNAGLYYLIGMGVYFWAYAEAEVRFLHLSVRRRLCADHIYSRSALCLGRFPNGHSLAKHDPHFPHTYPPPPPLPLVSIHSSIYRGGHSALSNTTALPGDSPIRASGHPLEPAAWQHGVQDFGPRKDQTTSGRAPKTSRWRQRRRRRADVNSTRGSVCRSPHRRGGPAVGEALTGRNPRVYILVEIDQTPSSVVYRVACRATLCYSASLVCFARLPRTSPPRRLTLPPSRLCSVFQTPGSLTKPLTHSQSLSLTFCQPSSSVSRHFMRTHHSPPGHHIHRNVTQRAA